MRQRDEDNYMSAMHSPLSNPPPILLAAATLDDGAGGPDGRERGEHCSAAGQHSEPSVPDSDMSDDTGDGILILEPLLGMVPNVACDEQEVTWGDDSAECAKALGSTVPAAEQARGPCFLFLSWLRRQQLL